MTVPVPPAVSGTNGPDVVTLTTPTTYSGLGGNDTITGSSGADRINGGSGDDHISAMGGNDVVRGGSGADMMKGGAGNDTFTFFSGDLVNTLGQNNGYSGRVDQIIDFHVKDLSNLSAEHDFLSFSGFGKGTTLVFDHYAGTYDAQKHLVADTTKQYYHIVDPTNASAGGYIMIQIANGHQLSNQDYMFL